ncbi:MAG: lysylphosphatidylglycerol synthase transmembrane domain-containing protein [Flavisolibacter sp.]
MTRTGNNRTHQSGAQADDVKSHLWLIYFALFLGVFILVIKHFSGIEKDFLLLRNVQPFWLAVAIMAQMTTYVFAAFIYRFLLHAFRVPGEPGIGSLIKASIVSLFFNQTVPSAGISGNAFFFRYLSWYRVTGNDALLVILAELFTYYSAIETLILLLLFASLFFAHSSHVIITTLVLGLAIYLFFTGIIFLVDRKNLFNEVSAWLQRCKLFKTLMKKVSAKIRGSHLSATKIQLEKHVKSPKDFLLAYFLQFTKAAPDAFTLFALFYGMGYPVSLYSVLLCLVCTQIVSLIPFLPGSMVLFESSMGFFFVVQHIPLSIAVVVTLLFRFLSFWLPIPLGLFFFRRWKGGAVVS